MEAIQWSKMILQTVKTMKLTCFKTEQTKIEQKLDRLDVQLAI